MQESDTEITQQVASREATSYEKQSLRLEKWQHIFTAVLTASAIVGFSVAVWQGYETRRQNDIMIKQMAQTDETLSIMRQQQRAEIAISDGAIKKLEPNHPVDFSFALMNHGETAGTIRHLGYWFSLLVPNEKLVDDISITAAISLINGQRNMQVFKGDRRMTSATYTAGFTKNDVANIESGKKLLRLMVVLDYKDAFGDAKMVWRAFIYDPKTGGMEEDESDGSYFDHWLSEEQPPTEEEKKWLSQPAATPTPSVPSDKDDEAKK